MNDLLELKKRIEADLKAVNAAIDVASRYSSPGSGGILVNNLGVNGSDEAFFTNADVRDAIFKIHGNYGAFDIEQVLKRDFPKKQLRRGQVPNVLFTLKQKGKIKMLREREGTKGALYSNIKINE